MTHKTFLHCLLQVSQFFGVLAFFIGLLTVFTVLGIIAFEDDGEPIPRIAAGTAFIALLILVGTVICYLGQGQ